MHRCGKCPAAWTGTLISHCGACHATFGGVTNFDKHRIKGKCRKPSTLGMIQNDKGTWRSPDERDVSGLRLLQRPVQGPEQVADDQLP